MPIVQKGVIEIVFDDKCKILTEVSSRQPAAICCRYSFVPASIELVGQFLHPVFGDLAYVIKDFFNWPVKGFDGVIVSSPRQHWDSKSSSMSFVVSRVCIP